MGGALQPAGPVAAEMARLWWAMLALGMVSFIAFLVLLALGLRRRRGTDEPGLEPEPPIPSRPWIVGGGVVQPAILIVVVFALTLVAMRTGPDAASGEALVIEVTGHQWWYEVHYPDLQITTANEVVIPTGRAVELQLTSADVIHSFWAPQLGGKRDLLPEGVTTLELQADEEGDFLGTCAEFCGLQHTLMRFRAIAMEPSAFDAWTAAQQRPAASPEGETAQRGRDVFLQANCTQCHTVAGVATASDPGPDLSHLASREWIGAGTLMNTPESLAAWIRDPHQFKDGVEMPASDLDDAQIQALVGYLGGLR